MSVILYDDCLSVQFSPLTDTRATSELRCGCFTMRERVERWLGESVGIWTSKLIAEALREGVARDMNAELDSPALLLLGRAAWSAVPEALGAEPWVGLDREGNAVCVYTGADWCHPLLSARAVLREDWARAVKEVFAWRDVADVVKVFAWPWQLISANASQLQADAAAFPLGRHCSDGPGAHLLGEEKIYLGEGVDLMPTVVIDARSGPVIVEEGTRILPHAFLQGPAYIGPGCLIQAGAVLRGGVSIGPVCKLGGEIEGSLIQGFSNKQHDGFLGHSYVGEWVNIAADCINSDLKNTYGTIRMAIGDQMVETGEMFLGMLVGDHAKIGINCAIPTGAVIGVGTSVVGPRAPVQAGAFEWIDGESRVPYELKRALDVASRVMARRGCSIGNGTRRLLSELHRAAWDGADSDAELEKEQKAE